MLAEFGFHTNPRDAAFLTNDDSLRQLAANQAEIIAAYFMATPAAPTAPTTPAPAPSTPTPPTTPTAPSTPSALQFKVGDIVQFTGGGVYVSSTQSVPAHSRPASRSRVTQLSANARNPYHLISDDGAGVHGWVVAGDVRALGGNVAAGSRVRIRPGATYFAGGAIPAWVMSDTWIVSSINGDRAVLGKNVSGKNNINSPIKVSDLVMA
jgi:hypothetical protein